VRDYRRHRVAQPALGKRFVTRLAHVKSNEFKQRSSSVTNCLFNDRTLPWLPVIAAFFVQFDVLFSGLLFDDFVHFYEISNISYMDYLRQPHQHLLHSFKTVLWSVESLFGVNPFVFMLIALILHLASVRLLFEIVFRLTGKIHLAAFGAALWGMEPYAIGTLAWISVHGHAYATTAVLWVLMDVVRYSQKAAVLRTGLLARHAFLLLVAATSFGAGLASTVIFPLVIVILNPLPSQRNRLLAVYGSVAVAVVFLYLFSLIDLAAGTDSQSISVPVDLRDAIIMRSTSLWGGFNDISKTLWAFVQLFSIGFSTLFFGPLVAGKISLITVDSLLLVAPFIAIFIALPLLVFGVFVSGVNERRRLLAMLLLVCASYGLIAYARSGAWFGIHPEAYRYHYLAPAFMAILFCLILSKLFDRFPQRLIKQGRVWFAVWLLLVIIPFYLSPDNVVKEALLVNQKKQLTDSMQIIDTALKKSPNQTEIYIANRPFKVFPWGYTPQHFPGLAALFVMTYPDNTVDGKRVYFLEESEDIVKMVQAKKGTRIADLVISAPKATQ
jgi:hypothetical protein